MTTTRTTQDLLAERRANVEEARHATDATTRETLLAHVAVLDLEIASRTVAS